MRTKKRKKSNRFESVLAALNKEIEELEDTIDKNEYKIYCLESDLEEKEEEVENLNDYIEDKLHTRFN